MNKKLIIKSLQGQGFYNIMYSKKSLYINEHYSHGWYAQKNCNTYFLGYNLQEVYNSYVKINDFEI
jgi:hypothetical protein